MNNARSHSNNPQILFKTFKDSIKKLAIAKAKTAIPKITKKLIQLKQEHKLIINNSSLSEPQRIAQAGPLSNQIEQLEKKKFQKAKNTTKTRFALEGETISKNSHRMAEITRNHHEILLTEGIHPDNAAEREAATEKVLEDIDKQSTLPDLRKEELGTPINEDLIKLALKESASGTAPGINGIPYEFWKMLSINQTNDKGTKEHNGQQPADTTDHQNPNEPAETKETKILETLTHI
jgi:hypothetical protein